MLLGFLRRLFGMNSDPRFVVIDYDMYTFAVLDRDQAFRPVAFTRGRRQAERWARLRNEEEELWERSIAVRASGSS